MTTFTISSRELANKCNMLYKVVSTKNTMAAMDYFLFTAKGNELEMAACDSEHYAVGHIRLDNPAEGVFALEAKTLVAALKELPDQPVTVTAENRNCTIRYSNGHFELPLFDLSADAYPTAPVLKDERSLTVSADTFRRVISKLAVFVPNDELRPVMNGICFKFEKDRLQAAASDGHSLIRLTENCTASDEGIFILALKSSRLAEAFLGKAEGDVSIAYSNTHSYIRFEEYELYSRLIEGRYPNFNSVIPAGYPNHVVAGKKEFVSCLKRVSVFANAASLQVVMSVDGANLTLSGENIDYSTSAKETLMVQQFGASVKVGLKATLMMTAFNSFDGENVRIEYRDHSSAVLYTHETPEQDYQQVVIQMPMLIG